MFGFGKKPAPAPPPYNPYGAYDPYAAYTPPPPYGYAPQPAATVSQDSGLKVNWKWTLLGIPILAALLFGSKLLKDKDGSAWASAYAQAEDMLGKPRQSERGEPRRRSNCPPKRRQQSQMAERQDSHGETTIYYRER